MKTNHGNNRRKPSPTKKRSDRVSLPPMQVSRVTWAKLKRWSALYDGDVERTLEAAIEQL